MAQEEEVIEDTSIFTAMKYISYFFNILNGILIARFLGPATFGVFSALTIIITYCQYAHLGLLPAMTKKVPFYKGKLEFGLVKETKNITFTGSVLITALIAIILVFVSFFLKGFTASTINSLRIISIVIILQQIFYFYQTHLMVEKNFWMLGKMLFVYSAAYFGFVMILIKRFSLEGVFFALLLAYSVTIIYLLKKEKFKFVPAMNLRKAWGYMQFGFPLLTIGVVSIFFISIDKLMILKFIGDVQLGYYSIAAMVLDLIYFIPGTIGYVLFPRILEKYGKKENEQHIRNHLFQPTIILAYLMSIVVGLVFITAPVAIYHILPKYIEGLTTLKILVCAGFFMSVVIVSDNFLITLNKEWRILSVQAVSAVIAIALSYILISLGEGIVGVAIATAVSYFFYNACIFISSFGHYVKGMKGFIKFFLKIYSPFLYVLVILAVLDTVPISGNLLVDIEIAFVKLVIFTLLILPLLWLINKKTGVVKLAFGMAISRLLKKSRG